MPTSKPAEVNTARWFSQVGWLTQIRVTDNFKMVVATATGGIAIAYFLMMILSFFGVNIGFFTGNGLFSIGLSLFVIGIAWTHFTL